MQHVEHCVLHVVSTAAKRLLLQLLLFHELDDLNLLPDPDLILLREAVVVLGLLRAVELVELGLHRGHLLLAVFLQP